MGLPIAALARLSARKRLPAGTWWRLLATVLLMALVLPLFLTAAVATVPVLLSAGLVVGVRRAWQWQAQRRQRQQRR